MSKAVWRISMCSCKQKTAYEMSISDWSSDVCSSDLFRCLVMVVSCGLGWTVSGESRSSGAGATDRPESERDADERGQGDGGKIARYDRGRADTDCDLPQVEQRVGDQPQRGGGPEADAALRTQQADRKSPRLNSL